MSLERFDIYTENGDRTGRTVERGHPLMPGEYHLCVEVWVVNSKGNVLIQKRSGSRKVLPGIWALTTGSVQAGETSLGGCVREAKEEIGIELNAEDLRLVERIVRRDANTIWDVYCVRRDFNLGDAKIQREEVDDVRWASPREMREMLVCGALYRYPEIYRIMERVERTIRLSGPGMPETDSPA